MIWVFNDELWVGTMLKGEIRWVLASTTNTVEEASCRHQTSPVASAALGRSMTGNLLLASSIKGPENLTLRILGDGPLGGIVTIGNALGEIRGYVREPLVDLPLRSPGKLDVAGAVGKGELVVSRTLEKGEIYNGMVQLISGEIAEDLVHYLRTSEQIPSAMLLGVLVEKDYHVAGAGGLLFQPLPHVSEEAIQILEDHLETLQAGISSIASQSKDMAEMLGQLMGGLPHHVLEKRPVKFSCTCSKTKLGETLLLLGKREIADLISAEGIEMVCHFCNEHYFFNTEELLNLMHDA
ncbi:MAG: Hsp33 family molecular chaperone HslO [Desulfitobacteriaceae bacterium]